MNTGKEDENTGERAIIDVEPFKTEDIQVVEGQKYAIIEHEGSEARFYPRTGAIMIFDVEKNSWIIRANRGGRVDIDGHEMAIARKLKKEEAIINGLEACGWEMDMRSASSVLSAIVAARAKNAIDDDGRTGNADAKFIFSLVSQGGEDSDEAPSLRVDMDKDAAREFIQAMKDVMSKDDN